MRTLTLLIIAITMACNAANYFVEGMEWKMVKLGFEAAGPILIIAAHTKKAKCLQHFME